MKKKIFMFLFMIVFSLGIGLYAQINPNLPCDEYEPYATGASSIYCGQYFMCIDDVWVRQYCPEGFEYDETNDTCSITGTFTHWTCGCYVSN